MSAVTYNPNTGEFFRDGKRCDSNKGRGYRCVKFFGKTVGAHRLAWFLHHGAWPTLEVDHIDRDRGNNRIGNLRLASRAENCVNVSSPRNTSGEKGVVFDKAGRKWQVKVFMGQVRVYANASHKLSATLAARLIRRTLHEEFAYQETA